MTPIATILIPVLDRPERVSPVFTSIVDSVQPRQVGVLFIASPGDTRELHALDEQEHIYLTVPWEPGPGDYARKINEGARSTETPWIFTGADDLHFHPGWLEECLRVHRRTGALVIGTNDLGNATVIRGDYATHLLVHRSYFQDAVIDQPGNVFCEEYSHNCVDSEMVETAKFHGVWAMAGDAHVEHLHHVWRKAPDDVTYAKGRAGHQSDRRLFHSRRHLWSRRVVRAYQPRVSSRRQR